MKLNSLQFGKAMSAALLVLLLVVVGSKKALAQNEVATLEHGDEMSAYYGTNALVEAHNAAVDGDIITLSSGTFTSINITKAITLHGAGYSTDTLGITPTCISGNFNIEVPNDSIYLVIEGIRFQGDITYRDQLHYAKFIKCCMNSLNRYTGPYNDSPHGRMVNDVQIINCQFNVVAEICTQNNSVTIINCAINDLSHQSYWGVWIWSSNLNIYNSIIGQIRGDGCYNLYNCIVHPHANSAYGQLTNGYAYNCIEIGSVFSNAVYTFDCMSADSLSEVFESFDGTFSTNTDFHLKEEIATTFMGNDGSEVGIFGGMRPYNPRPSYLILNRCNVASRSTIDGKLSVDIEVISNGE